MSLLAEISDKMPACHATLLGAVVLASIAIGLARIRWWLALLIVPVIALLNWIWIAALTEPDFGRLIIQELGYEYVCAQFAVINLPIVIGAVVVARMRNAQRKTEL